MQHTFLQFELSPWLLILCVAVAGLGSYLLYSKDSNWAKRIHYSLIAFRFLCLFFLSLLLLGPILNQINNVVEKPTWIIGIDNSTSIVETLDSTTISNVLDNANSLKTALQDGDYLANVRTFSSNEVGGFDIVFDAQTTNIQQFLKSVESDYEGRHLAGVVLVSDGIYNRGLSPLYTQYNFPIHTIGVGDTLPKNDLFIQEIKYNKISYQGNDFPIVVTIGNKGNDGTAQISLTNKGRIIHTKEIDLSKDQPISQIIFEVEAKESGLQKFKVEVSAKDDEHNTSNNIRNAYIDIIDGKERILLIASSPHPDIKAIASSISTKKNYELVTFLPSIQDEKPEGKFDLIIYHQIPNRSAVSRKLLIQYPPKDTPFLMISGLKSDLRLISNTLNYISIQKKSNDNDQVTAAFNQDFIYFNLSEELQNTLNLLPPVEVPFSDITVGAGASPLLYQRLGNVITQNPLILIDGTSEVRSALLLGEGIWRWRLYEYNQNGNNDSFNELILKLVQYLATKEDKRKFKFTPVKNELTSNETVKFEAEVYNELYELIYGQTIELELLDESGASHEYSFVNSPGSKNYDISGLPSGIYRYTANTNANGISLNIKGELVITDQQIENLNTTADHYLLQKLAAKNNGSFHSADSFPSLDQIAQTKVKGIIHSSESFSSLINFEWLFMIFLVLLSAEWFIRKYNGSY